MKQENKEEHLNTPVSIDCNKLEELKLTPSQYFLAYCIYYNYKGTFNEIRNNYGNESSFKEDLYQLIKKGYLNTNNKENIYLVEFEKCEIIGIFTDSKQEDELTWDEFVDKFRDTFPKGVKSGGFYVKSSRRDIEVKLKKFNKEYKGYSKKVILEAVKQYVEQSKADGYGYMKLAHYFILKNNESMLASYCDAINEDATEEPASTIFNDSL